MQSRPFGRTGRQVGEIGFGAWAIGADWDHVEAALDAATTATLEGIDAREICPSVHGRW